MILITGGQRSGKSRYALALAKKISDAGKDRIFLATAQEVDHDLRARIDRHKEDRGTEFTTLEEPLHLAKVIKELKSPTGVIVIDCLTVWVNNLLYYTDRDQAEISQEVNSFLQALLSRPCPVVMVTNEVGSGIMPENTLARRFADELGRINQEIARLSDAVVLMTAGIPLYIKGGQDAGVMDTAF